MQKKIKDMTIAKVGTIASGNINRVYPAMTTATTTLGLGVYSTQFGKVSNVKGNGGIFAGIAINTYKSYNDTLVGGGVVVPLGGSLDVATEGDVFLSVTKGSKMGDYVFSKDADGTLSTNASNTPIADNSLTKFRVLEVVQAEDDQNSKNEVVLASSTVF